MRVNQEHLAIRQQQTIHARISAHTFAIANDLVDVIQMHIGRAPGAANQSVDFAFVQHHGANQRKTAAHIDLGQLLGHAFARHHVPIGLPKIAVAVVLFNVDDLVVFAFLQTQTKLLNALRNDGGATNQCGLGQVFVDHDLHRAQHALFFALGKAHAFFGTQLGGRINRLHDGARGIDKALQLLDVGLHVLDGSTCHTAVCSGLGHGRRNLHHQAWIKRLGN